MCTSNTLSSFALLVSEYVPGLREQFRVPEAELACLHYEGMLGERQMAEPVLLTAKGKYVSFELAADAQQEFKALCLELLELRFPGWPTGEGAEGQFLWDLRSDTLTHTHKLRTWSDEAVNDAAAVAIDEQELSHLDIPF